ncbi:hypothetical protein Pmani_005299 [Petrolisthes manimaculis]|uniref:Pleckstrin homology domain-containing family J member 1 n=1 Tax=Petrolisthes manimaculis TaxID=1843537 RepID=A0AAE1UMB9_9EUCA|nr:hypothetical protein Pmani_005299 [Petrolisthes manimaculis]
MRFNSEQLAEFAVEAGDHEGRLTHKPPARTLYDSACKERWFKLKANFLFYYRLNEFGGVAKNEPHGVFVLENVDVQREDTAEAPFGFAIKWMDDLDRKHLFFAQSETSVCTWIDKIIRASYHNLKANLDSLRYQIRTRTGKDPLEHLDTPLPQGSFRRKKSHQSSQFHVPLENFHLSHHPAHSSLSAPSTPSSTRSPSQSTLALQSNNLSVRSPSLNLRFPKSPSQKKREPVRPSPVPPPRRNKKQSSGNGQLVVEELVPGVGRTQASFQCHLADSCTPSHPTNLLD